MKHWRSRGPSTTSAKNGGTHPSAATAVISPKKFHSQSKGPRVPTAIEQCLRDREVDEIFSVYVAEYEQSWTLFNDVLPCLDSLVAVRLGLRSNGAAIEQRRKLSSLGLGARFAKVLTSEEAGATKPAPAIF